MTVMVSRGLRCTGTRRLALMTSIARSDETARRQTTTATHYLNAIVTAAAARESRAYRTYDEVERTTEARMMEATQVDGGKKKARANLSHL